MAKRRAAAPSPEQVPAKRSKVGSASSDTNPGPATPSPNLQFSEIITLIDISYVAPADEALEEEGIVEAGPSAPTKVKTGLKDEDWIPLKKDEWNLKKPAKEDWESHWGQTPMPGDPLPHPLQPAARTSNAAVNPPLWEDRKFRIKRGSRYVKYFGPLAPANADSLPANRDQEDLLVMKILDMRPKGRNDPTPRRAPDFYSYHRGKPKDWNDLDAIKTMNDRRDQAIHRMTLDSPWTKTERETLADICREFPDASIWKITQKFNGRFKDQDFKVGTAFNFTPPHPGRTVESVRNEYMMYKPRYEQGQIQTGIRYRSETSRSGRQKAKKLQEKIEEIFGPPDKELEQLWDQEVVLNHEHSNPNNDELMPDQEEEETEESGNDPTFTNEQTQSEADQDEINNFLNGSAELGTLDPQSRSAYMDSPMSSVGSDEEPDEELDQSDLHPVVNGDTYMSAEEDEEDTRPAAPPLQLHQHPNTGAVRMMSIDENYSDTEEDVEEDGANGVLQP